MDIVPGLGETSVSVLPLPLALLPAAASPAVTAASPPPVAAPAAVPAAAAARSSDMLGLAKASLTVTLSIRWYTLIPRASFDRMCVDMVGVLIRSMCRYGVCVDRVGIL